MEGISQTDPANELADLCVHLASYTTDSRGNSKPGDEELAEKFGVEVWSQDFWEIIFALLQRIRFVEECVASLEAPESTRRRAQSHLDTIRSAFSRDAMRQQWKVEGSKRLGRHQSDAIRMIGFKLAETHPIAALTEEQVTGLRDDVDQLLSWLEEKQLSDRDFIRLNLIEGLRAFQFRLKHFRWVGWGYSLEGLKEVITAYLILEGKIEPNRQPEVAAVAKKVGLFLRKVWSIGAAARDVTETADWALRFYGVVSLATAANPQIAGLLK